MGDVISFTISRGRNEDDESVSMKVFLHEDDGKPSIVEGFEMDISKEYIEALAESLMLVAEGRTHIDHVCLGSVRSYIGYKTQ